MLSACYLFVHVCVCVWGGVVCAQQQQRQQQPDNPSREAVLDVYFTDLPIFINLVYVPLVLLGAALNVTVGLVWFVGKYYYVLMYQMGEASRLGLCLQAFFMLLLKGVVFIAPATVIAAIALLWMSLFGWFICLYYYDPRCGRWSGLQRGCIWLWQCTTSVDSGVNECLRGVCCDAKFPAYPRNDKAQISTVWTKNGV